MMEPVVTPQMMWQWEPFTYVVEGFEGQMMEIGGVFPADVRERCPFVVKRIHGPVVKGFWSWVMKQLVGD